MAIENEGSNSGHNGKSGDLEQQFHDVLPVNESLWEQLATPAAPHRRLPEPAGLDSKACVCIIQRQFRVVPLPRTPDGRARGGLDTGKRDAAMARILIVDDSPDNIAIASMILEKDNYEILTATSGEQALEMARKARPDVILLDIQMPQMDGFQVCRRLKSEAATESIPVLFVSAHHKDAEAVSRGLTLGGDDYIVKPFNSTELRARVNVLARLKSHVDELLRKNFELEAANQALAHNIERLTQAQKVLEQLAVTDPLTGLYNRRYFEERMRETFSLIGRQKVTVHLLMFDLDHFKAINDRWGHSVGDAVLVHFSEIMRRCVRRHDIIARIGGEEFIIAMLNIPLEQATRAAERIRKEVEGAPYRLGPDSIPVTTSIGLASFGDGWSDNEPPTLDSLMKQADAALYRAKSEGRNRLVIA